jgi:maleate isomerase
MYGWRARIGKISPSRSDSFTYEFYKIAPEGVVLVLSGFTIYELVGNDIERAHQRIEESAKDLAKVGVDFIITGGTPIFTYKGKGSDQAVIERIKELTGIPSTTTITSEMSALEKLGMKRIAIASPFEEERYSLLKDFLEQVGFDVLNIKGLGIRVASEIAKVTSHEVYRFAKEVFLEAPDADGIFIPCPRWPTIGVIDKLEMDLGVPVVTSSAAMIWKAFDHLKIKEPVLGYGQLLENP